MTTYRGIPKESFEVRDELVPIFSHPVLEVVSAVTGCFGGKTALLRSSVVLRGGLLSCSLMVKRD